ncbi:MAG: suppressor of fused domain protein [Bacteroidales bacterium]|nr:suppressor of fused domain protein [Bacteroidales bacterium]
MNEDEKEVAPQYCYTVKEMEKISSFIKEQYGDFEIVAHEKESPDIHCDIAIVPPTEEQPYYKLVTMGAGAYKMNVPKDLQSRVCDRAEYVVFLPKDWKLESDKEEDYWPIRMLKTVARMPVESDEWLFYGHTLSLKSDESPVAEGVGFNSCILLVSKGKDQCVKQFKLGNRGKKVAFYQLYPLYPEELEYKLENSFYDLMDKVPEEEMKNQVINIHRKNFCK